MRKRYYQKHLVEIGGYDVGLFRQIARPSDDIVLAWKDVCYI